MDRISGYPELTAIAVLIVGFVAARLASMAVGRLMAALDRYLARTSTTDTGALTPRTIRVTRAIVFWAVLIFSVAVALKFLDSTAGLQGVGTLVIVFLPQILIAVAIIVAGHLLGLLASSVLAGVTDEEAEDAVGPRILYGVVVAIAIVVALQHIGINITFVTRLILVIVAVVGGGLMLAFALGAQRHVANLLARRELARLEIGEKIRVGNIEGTIVEIHSTAVDVATDKGIASIPSSQIAEIGVLRRSEGQPLG